jgi:hypothetical protein
LNMASWPSSKVMLAVSLVNSFFDRIATTQHYCQVDNLTSVLRHQFGPCSHFMAPGDCFSSPPWVRRKFSFPFFFLASNLLGRHFTI